MQPERSVGASTAGRWGAVTTISKVKPGWWRPPALRAVFALGRTTPALIGRLIDMRVIMLARWTLLPSAEHPQELLFETNWSGTPQAYIPDFGQLMQLQWKSIWGNTVGFPGPVPTTGLVAHVDTVDWGCDHYWSDYDEDASTQVVLGARELESRLWQFARETRGIGAGELAVRWRAFLTEVAGLL